MTSSLFNQAIIDIINDTDKKISVLTGAGISAESGIPTFRGPEGYWTVGSRVYMPEEVATLSMFEQHPLEVWEWYLYRLGVCLHAEPNEGHRALVQMEHHLGDRFTLITQNIDNLHIRAGNSLERTFQIHGNINYTRCMNGCNSAPGRLADVFREKHRQKTLNEIEAGMLHCQLCGGWLRPHVLWFDEYYDEENFRFDSSLRIAEQTDLLVIVGTSGATTLPNHIASVVCSNNGTIIDINPEHNPFSDMAGASADGQFFKMSSSKVLPKLAKHCKVCAPV